MASGQQLAERNFHVFIAWIASQTDSDFRARVGRGLLSRKEIAKECGFAKSVLDQNPRIKAALRDLENSLRVRGVLPPVVALDPTTQPSPDLQEPGGRRAAHDAERVRRLEVENASLKAEVAELKRASEKYAVLRDALALTARLPR